jgi:hypothetical protein
MPAFAVNSSTRIVIYVRDATGALANVSGNLSVSALHADGVTTIAASNAATTATGTYVWDIVPAKAGRWAVTATGTLASGLAYRWTDIFEATDLGAAQIVSIADAMQALNLDLTSIPAGYIPGLRDFITGITRVIESITGPVLPVTVDEWLDGGGPYLLLTRRPVLSVTSVVEVIGTTQYTLTLQDPGGSVDSFGYSVNLAEGVLIRRVSGIATYFAAGKQNVHAVYQAGTLATSANVRNGALELIRVNYASQQIGNLVPWGNGSVNDVDVAGSYRMGFFVPNRVMEQLLPDSARTWVG